MRIAISGHRGLPAPVQALVDQAIRAALAGQQHVTGLSCLADGPDQIFAHAAQVHRLPFTQSTPQAHMAASELMLKHADQLWAVWDGQPARGYGGTADVVAAARASGLPVQVIWPPGAHRD